MKELNAIIEYESARREIISIKNQISQSTAVYNDVGMFLSRKCTAIDPAQCFERAWNWNTKNAVYIYWETCGGYEDDEPDAPDGEYPPELCEFCKITQRLVDERKLAKKRLGIAKRRLSALAKPHLPK